MKDVPAIRVEHATMFNVFKHKSWLFKYLEGLVKDKDDVVDTEEAA